MITWRCWSKTLSALLATSKIVTFATRLNTSQGRINRCAMQHRCCAVPRPERWRTADARRLCEPHRPPTERQDCSGDQRTHRTWHPPVAVIASTVSRQLRAQSRSSSNLSTRLIRDIRPQTVNFCTLTKQSFNPSRAGRTVYIPNRSFRSG